LPGIDGKERQAGLIELSAIADSNHLEQLTAAGVEIREIAERDTRGAPALASAAWDLLCRLVPVELQARCIIERSTTEGPKQAITAVCCWLAGHPSNALGEFVPRLFSMLLDAAVHNVDSRAEIDGTLGLLLETAPAKRALSDLSDPLKLRRFSLIFRRIFPECLPHLLKVLQSPVG
jgi:hypothetical protein